MASNVFQHTGSVSAGTLENPGESNNAVLDLELLQTYHDDDHSRGNKLEGVVSDNPFASDAQSASNSDGLNVDSEAANRPSHPVAEESDPPGAVQDAFPDDNVDPLDTSLSGGSNINHGRSESGTDITVRRQSFTEQSQRRQHDTFRKPAEETPRIAFATSDQVDNAHKSDPQSDRRASVRRDTMSHAYDFSGKISLSRNNSVVARTFLAYPNPPIKDRQKPKSTFAGVRRNLWSMASTFPYWDMAFWSGFTYTWGSVLFVIDGVWSWGPVGWDVTWAPEENYAGGIFFFIGALMYQVGAVMAYLEAVNNGSFSGHAMKRFIDGHDEDQKAMVDARLHGFLHHANPLHHHHHPQQEDSGEQTATIDPTEGWKTLNQRELRARDRSVYAMRKPNVPRRGGVDLGEDQDGVYEYTSWRWWPKWETLKTYHVQEIGYIACSIQLLGATLYSWCGLVSVPGISSKWTADATWYGGYWLPEVWGSCCFLGASFMFLSQAQHKWWKPEVGFIGWWIGFWAMIGSWGFLLNGVFGVVAQALPDSGWAEWASECCTTWGSFGYLLSALCQWYAAVGPSVQVIEAA